MVPKKWEEAPNDAWVRKATALKAPQYNPIPWDYAVALPWEHLRDLASEKGGVGEYIKQATTIGRPARTNKCLAAWNEAGVIEA